MQIVYKHRDILAKCENMPNISAYQLTRIGKYRIVNILVDRCEERAEP